MRRLLRGALGLVAALVLAVAGAVLALLWTPFGRDSAFALARALAARSGVELRIEGARGVLAGPLQVRRLHLRTAGLDIRADDLDLDWRPSDLAALRLTVTRASAARLAVTRLTSPAPTTPPASTPWPLHVTAPALAVGDLRLASGARVLDVGGVRAAFESRAGPGGEILRYRFNTRGARGDGATRLGRAPATRLRLRLDGLDPSTLAAALPRAAISGRIELETGAGGGAVRGRLRGAPAAYRMNVALDLDASWRGRRVTVAAGRVVVGDNTLSIQGAFGGNGDVLDARLDAPDLAGLSPLLRGTLALRARAQGEWAHPLLRVDATARALRIADQRVRAASLHARVTGYDNPRVSARAEVSGYRYADRPPVTARLVVDGTWAAHSLAFDATTGPWRVRAGADGAWTGARWNGRLARLDLAGPVPARLVAPVRVTLARGDIHVGAGRIDVAGGHLDLARFARTPGRWVLKGAARGVHVAAFTLLLRQPPAVRTTLVLNADASLVDAARLDGEVRVWRARGDVFAPAPVQVALGLQALSADLKIVNDAVTADAQLAGTRAGTARLHATTVLARRGTLVQLARNAPFTFNGTLALNSIAWLVPVTTMSIDGAVSGWVSGGGRLDAPQWQGDIEGRKLALRMPAEGVALHDGVLSARLEGRRLRVQRLHWPGPAGALDASGEIDLARLVASARVTLTSLALVDLPDRQLVASGDARLQVDPHTLDLNGNVRVDRAHIVLPAHTGPTLSDDVVIVGRAPPPRARAFKAHIDVGVDLGSDFALQGRGLDVHLTGAVRVRAAARGLPLAYGDIRADGTYMAYGQRLRIERGTLSFTGPVDDPGLDIQAWRRHQTVEAGVAVSGTAMHPVVKLVSNPDVPDSEKLSWLVLGHGTESTTRADLDVLARAAASLVGQGQSVPLEDRVAHRLGLDELRLSGGSGLESSVVTVGKRVSSRLFVSYEQALGGTAVNVLRARYALGRYWSLETQTSRASAGTDVLFTLPFD